MKHMSEAKEIFFLEKELKKLGYDASRAFELISRHQGEDRYLSLWDMRTYFETIFHQYSYKTKDVGINTLKNKEIFILFYSGLKNHYIPYSKEDAFYIDFMYEFYINLIDVFDSSLGNKQNQEYKNLLMDKDLSAYIVQYPSMRNRRILISLLYALIESNDTFQLNDALTDIYKNNEILFHDIYKYLLDEAERKKTSTTVRDLILNWGSKSKEQTRVKVLLNKKTQKTSSVKDKILVAEQDLLTFSKDIIGNEISILQLVMFLTKENPESLHTIKEVFINRNDAKAVKDIELAITLITILGYFKINTTEEELDFIISLYYKHKKDDHDDFWRLKQVVASFFANAFEVTLLNKQYNLLENLTEMILFMDDSPNKKFTTIFKFIKVSLKPSNLIAQESDSLKHEIIFKIIYLLNKKLTKFEINKIEEIVKLSNDDYLKKYFEQFSLTVQIRTNDIDAVKMFEESLKDTKVFNNLPEIYRSLLTKKLPAKPSGEDLYSILNSISENEDLFCSEDNDVSFNLLTVFADFSRSIYFQYLVEKILTNKKLYNQLKASHIEYSEYNYGKYLNSFLRIVLLVSLEDKDYQKILELFLTSNSKAFKEKIMELSQLVEYKKVVEVEDLLKINSIILTMINKNIDFYDHTIYFEYLNMQAIKNPKLLVPILEENLKNKETSFVGYKLNNNFFYYTINNHGLEKFREIIEASNSVKKMYFKDYFEVYHLIKYREKNSVVEFLGFIDLIWEEVSYKKEFILKLINSKIYRKLITEYEINFLLEKIYTLNNNDNLLKRIKNLKGN